MIQFEYTQQNILDLPVDIANTNMFDLCHTTTGGNGYFPTPTVQFLKRVFTQRM